MKTFFTNAFVLINTAIFVAMAFIDRNIWLPNDLTLIMFGARDRIAISYGEYFRFTTPIFVHVGILHFLLNNVALYYIGRIIEPLIGHFWFVSIYLLTGICGNIAGLYWNPEGIGAGASGAIFGLIGTGVVWEFVVHSRMAHDRYIDKSMWDGFVKVAVINLGLGALIPQIDQAAHIGGLLTGIALTISMLWLRPNAWLQQRVLLGMIMFALTIGCSYYVLILALAQ